MASRSRGSRFAGIIFVLFLAAAGACAFVFRDELYRLAARFSTATKPPDRPKSSHAPPSPANDKDWTLDLTQAEIPDVPAAGRIHGQSFMLQRATIQGGILHLRQGNKWPPDVGLTIQLFADRPEDLAGKRVRVEASRTQAPKVVLRWKDEQQNPKNKTIHPGYALQVEFGQVSDKRLPGKLYLATPDAEKSFVAGTFSAEIRKPSSSKPNPPFTSQRKR